MGYILPHILLLSPRLPSLAAIDIPAPTMGECVQEKQTRVRTTNGEEYACQLVNEQYRVDRCEHGAAGFWNEGKEISRGSRSQTKRNAYVTVGANENDYDNSRRRRRRRGGEEMDNTIRNHETNETASPRWRDKKQTTIERGGQVNDERPRTNGKRYEDRRTSADRKKPTRRNSTPNEGNTHR